MNTTGWCKRGSGTIFGRSSKYFEKFIFALPLNSYFQGMISDAKKEEIRDAADIVEVVSDYVITISTLLCLGMMVSHKLILASMPLYWNFDKLSCIKP